MNMIELMRRGKARVALLITYAALSFLVVLYFAGAGHGSYAPPAILFSWGIVPWQHGLVEGTFGFLVLSALYLSAFFVFNTVLARSANVRVSMIPVVVHMAGVIVALAGMKHGHLCTAGRLAASIAVSAPLAALYLTLDWTMLRKTRRSAGVGTDEPRG
jgi:hypothetical protein